MLAHELAETVKNKQLNSYVCLCRYILIINNNNIFKDDEYFFLNSQINKTILSGIGFRYTKE